MPKASIIITTHNRPKLLPKAVESARAAGTDIEIIVVDDASVDETAGICKQFANVNYVRVERNQRVAGARNVGVVASHGEYITFLDDDDLRLPASLDRQIDALEKEPHAGLIYGQAIIKEGDEKRRPQIYPRECPQGDIFWKLLGLNFIPCGSAVFRRSCLSRVGLLDNGIPGIDDWDLWVRIAEIYRIIAVAFPVITWRRSTPVSNQGTSRAARLVLDGILQFRETWMNLPRTANAPRKTRRAAWQRFSENMAEHLIWESARSLRRGEVVPPWKNLSIIPRLHPLTLMCIAEHRIFRLPRTRLPESLASFIN